MIGAFGSSSVASQENAVLKEKLNTFIESDDLNETLEAFEAYKQACIDKIDKLKNQDSNSDSSSTLNLPPFLQKQNSSSSSSRFGSSSNLSSTSTNIDASPIDLTKPEDESWRKLPEYLEIEEIVQDNQFTMATREPWIIYSNLRKASLRSIPHLRPMWKGLDNHFEAVEYEKSAGIMEEFEQNREKYNNTDNNTTTKYPQERNILIIGAGPAGLRMAIEASFLKFNHIVVAEESADTFERKEVLEAWPFDLIDLRDLGVRDIYSDFGVHGHDVISTSRLQLCLLKIALILGVQIYTNSKYKYVNRFENKKSPYFTATFETPHEELKNYKFNVLIDASGSNSTIGREFGFVKETFSGIHNIAITANFDTDTNIANLSKIKYENLKHGVCQVQLSNVTYNKDETHYIMATPDKDNLIETGVLIEDKESVDELVDSENVDYEILASYLRRVADKCRIPATCMLTLSKRTGKPCIGIYNVSERHCCNKPSTFITEPYEYVPPTPEPPQKITKKIPNQERIDKENVYNERMKRRKELELEMERKRKAEEEARRKAEEEARKKAEEEARRKAAEEEAKRKEEEEKRKLEEEKRKKEEEELKNKMAEEAAARNKKAEEDAKKRREEAALAKKKLDEDAKLLNDLRKARPAPGPRPLSRTELYLNNSQTSEMKKKIEFNSKPKDFPSKNLSGLVSKRMSFFAQVSDEFTGEVKKNTGEKKPMVKKLSKLNMKKWEKVGDKKNDNNNINSTSVAKERPSSSLAKDGARSSSRIMTWNERQKELQKQQEEEKKKKEELLRKAKEEDDKLIKAALDEKMKEKEMEKERLRKQKEEEEKNHVKQFPKEFEKEALEKNEKEAKQKEIDEEEAARRRREEEYAKAEQKMKESSKDNGPKKALFVAMIGDALLEPIWEQGNGLAYSTLSAMDVAWILQMMGEPEKWPMEMNGGDAKGPSILTKHEKMYWQLLACTSENLQSQERYTIDPLIRYDRVGKRMKIEHQKIVAKLMAEKYPSTPLTRNKEKRISLWTTPGI